MGKNGFLIGLVIVVVIAVLGIIVIYVKTSKNMPNQWAKQTTPAPGKKTTTPVPAGNKAAETSEAVTPTEEAVAGNEEFEFRFTGCILMPKFKSAFVLNILTNNEQMYQEGGFLHSLKTGRWTIFKITSSEVTLQQYYPDGSVAKERIMQLSEKAGQKKTGDILHSFTMGEKKPETSKTKENIDLTKPEDLDKAMKETSFSEMMKLIHSLPEALIQSVLNNIPESYLRQKLDESSLGNAITEDTFKNTKPAEIINNLRKVADDFTPKGDPVLSFSADVNKTNNSPITPTDTFSPHTRRIYTCFKNDGTLAKLDKVIIKWTNTSNQKIYNWAAFPINPSAPNNFIYLNMDQDTAWEPGNYLITIYKQIQDVNPVAYGQFEVK